MVAGEKRICTDLLRVTNGRIFGKIGAEGVYGISFFEQRWGIGLKIEDGGFRALAPTIVEVLKQLGAITKNQLRSLETYHYPTVLNYRQEVVGKIRPSFELRESDGPGG